MFLLPTEIARYFGESTPDGIGWQFRSIKADADKLKKAVDAGQSPASALGRSQSGAIPVATPKSARKRVATTTPRTASSKKTRKVAPKESDEEGDAEVDYEALDSTPTKEPKRQTYIDQDVYRRVTGHTHQPIMSGALPALDTAHEPTPSEDDFVPTPTQTFAPAHSFNSTQPSQTAYASSFDQANSMSDDRWNTMADDHKNFVDQQYYLDNADGEI